MISKKEYIFSLTCEYSFPEEETAAMLQACDAVYSNPEANALFLQQLMLYEDNIMFSMGGAYDNIRKAADYAGIRRETALTLFHLCMTKHLRSLYDLHHLPSEQFDGIIEDIRIKSAECLSVRGVYGTFVENWYEKFFLLTRFCYGILQFEPFFMPLDIEAGGKSAEKGSFAIEVHVPGGQPLDRSKCEKAIMQAYEHYLPFFADGTVKFFCDSWLLAPENRMLLPAESNIVRFMDLFSIVPGDEHLSRDYWRIFGKEDCSDASVLPRDTSLRRIYAGLIENGIDPNVGLGLLFVKDAKMI